MIINNLPILTYGGEIWGYENLDLIELVHVNLLRTVTKPLKRAPGYNYGVYRIVSLSFGNHCKNSNGSVWE